MDGTGVGYACLSYYDLLCSFPCKETGHACDLLFLIDQQYPTSTPHRGGLDSAAKLTTARKKESEAEGRPASISADREQSSGIRYAGQEYASMNKTRGKNNSSLGMILAILASNFMR